MVTPRGKRGKICRRGKGFPSIPRCSFMMLSGSRRRRRELDGNRQLPEANPETTFTFGPLHRNFDEWGSCHNSPFVNDRPKSGVPSRDSLLGCSASYRRNRFFPQNLDTALTVAYDFAAFF